MRALPDLAVTFAFLAFPTVAQQRAIYAATGVAAVAQSGGSTKIRIQIVFYSSEAERAELKEAFSKDGSDKRVILFRSQRVKSTGRSVFEELGFSLVVAIS